MNAIEEQIRQENPKTSTARKLKAAFFVYPMAFQSPGGGEVQLLKTKEYLEKIGVEVKLFDSWNDKLEDFDIFHVFGSVKYCINEIRTAKFMRVKTALSTICWYSWKSAWLIYPSFDKRMASMARQFAKSFFPFLPSMRKSMMQYSDILFPNSQTEADQLVRYFQIPLEKIFIVPNGVDPIFALAKPDPFISRFGIRDFILCAGRIEPRKNQLNMIRALKGTNIPLVFIGNYVPLYRSYYEACRREADKMVHFLGAFPHDSELLRSAYAACNTFLLASWLETPGLAALEAALAGAKVVITNQGAAREYFSDYAAYVSPDRPNEIRKRTLEAYHKPKNSGLKNYVSRNYLWENTAQKTLEGYERLFQVSENTRPGSRLLAQNKSRLQKKPIKIGIDIQSIEGKITGLGVYTKNLTRYLAEHENEHFCFEFFKTQEKSDFNTFRRWRWENIELPRRARRECVDVLHVPAFAPPATKGCKVVVTVHDLIGILFPNQLGLPSRLYWGKWLPFCIQRADAIIADSENTKKDIVQTLRIPESKIRVIYPSGHENFSVSIPSGAIRSVKNKFKIQEKYFLFVGTIEPRKNLARVVEAFMTFLKTNHTPQFQLVVVGSQEFAHGRFFRTLDKQFHKASEKVVFTDYVPQEELNALYCGSIALLYPSLYEGFGIPILEAMASGTPVITSTITSVPEVAGDAAYLVDPFNVQALANAMSNLVADSNLRSQLIEKGFERIKKFSWHKTAQETIQVYESLLKS